jgi:phosphatidylserine/phosphatidylglycerophosphate/cardiolipin synthase-like enzyme/uncharacterized membrane protein YdjX (TVP38/TMEM64 family)
MPRAERIAVLVDGEAYFAALRRSLIRARRSIAIAAWDIHSCLDLVRGDTDAGGPDDDLPTVLGPLLVASLERRPTLQVFILLWDYAPIYALEREPLLFGDAPWGHAAEHPRLHFIKDNAHPLTASQHQKLVVVDGRIAWCGGFDLSKWRWDTTAHRANEPRRCDPDGHPYPPFHDLQMLVDGAAADALAALFAERWRQAGGDRWLLEQADSGADADPWPSGVEPLLRDHAVAIARTLPAYEGRDEVREVERLYLDMIDAAERFIYVENQYLTSRSLADALCRVLARDDGPEVVLVLPQQTGHWLEQHTMDILRARVLERLRDADRHDRLRVVYPDVPGLGDACLMVHAKLMIVDDRVLRVASSNLSNRSMGLDSECDLCVVAEDADEQAAITGLRRRLMAMLGSGSEPALADLEQAAIDAGRAGLLDALDALVGSEPTCDGPRLVMLDGQVDPDWDRQLPDERLIDPDRPLNPDLVADAVVGKENTGAVRRRLLIITGLIGLLLALAAAWRWTALGDWLQPQPLAETLQSISTAPWGPPAGIAAMVVASLLAVPATLLILAAALIFGPVMGTVVAMVSAVLSALAGYGIGRAAGGGLVQQLAGQRAGSLRRRLSKCGIPTIVTLRIVPVAPFAVLNLVAGAIHVSLRDYFIGTVIGMLPGVIAMSVFAEGLVSLLGRLDLRAVALLLVGGISLVGLFWLGRHMLRSGASGSEGGAG